MPGQLFLFYGLDQYIRNGEIEILRVLKFALIYDFLPTHLKWMAIMNFCRLVWPIGE